MDNEIVQRDIDLPAIVDDNLIVIAERAEKRIEAVNKIKTNALKVTNSHDWIDQQGKPYLQVSGAEKIARLFGISWTINEPVLEYMPDGHFTYTYKGSFSLGGASIEAIGTRSSKDGFFKRFDYSQKDEQGKTLKVELPASEIDKTDVKKGAYTNCIGNGITRLLGIRNLSYEELGAAGIIVNKKVEYAQKEEDSGNKDIRAEITRMIWDMSGKDAKKAGELLESFTSFVPAGKTEADRVRGKKDVKTLTEKQLQPTYGKIKLSYEDWQKNPPVNKDDVFMECEANISLCDTIEDVDSIIKTALQAGCTGERMADLRLRADRQKTEIRERG